VVGCFDDLADQQGPAQRGGLDPVSESMSRTPKNPTAKEATMSTIKRLSSLSLLGAVVAATFVVLTACGGDDNKSSASSTRTPAASA